MHNSQDKKQLYNRVVYLYFCFFSMFTAEYFSMNAVYGAALFFSFSGALRMAGYVCRGDRLWIKTSKILAASLFALAGIYLGVMYPSFFPGNDTAFAIAIIALPLIERKAEDFILRKKERSQIRHSVAAAVLPVEAVFTIAAGAIALAAGIKAFYTIAAAMAFGMVLAFSRQLILVDYPAVNPAAAPAYGRVRSARLYDGMVIFSGAALNIFAFTYILVIMLAGTHDFFFDFFAVFAGLSLVYAVIYILTFRAAKSSLLQKIGKNAAFVLGTAISIFALYIFRDSWFMGALVVSMQTILLLIGLMLQMTALVGLNEDVRLVFRLFDSGIDEAALEIRSARLSLLTSAVSEAVFLIVLILIIGNPLFFMADVRQYVQYAPYIGSSVAVIPAVFLIISLIYSLKQPLTKKYGRRLRAYEKIKQQGRRNPDMEKRLVSVLVKRYKKRIGVYIIKAFLKRIMYHTVEGRGNVSELPGVFVFNHGELYGPVAAVVFLPYDIRPWILNNMIDRKEITAHMYEGTFSKMRWLPVFMRKLIAGGLSPIVVWALRSFDPIPVYRGAAKEVLQTFALSVECLNSGDSILLFPENPEAEYGEKLSDFYSGFANLGRMYYKKTSRQLVFYPVFASRKSRTLHIGQGVKYFPGKGREERDRIVAELENSMRELQDTDEL